MRLVFMGTGRISATSLERILAAGHELPLVVTRPDRPRGRSGRPAPPEVKVLALDHGLSVHQPERAREEATVALLAETAPTAIVVVAYNQLLPAPILDIPPLGCINVHLSLLPRYRGAAPIQHAILNGEEVTGVTVMRMAEKFDTGPILRQADVPILPDETTGDLSPRLATAGADLLVRVLAELEAGPVEGVPQDAALASRAPILRKEHGRLDWTRPATEIRNRIRAMTPWPSAYTFLLREDAAHPADRLILLATTAEEGEGGAPGEILEASPSALRVMAGEGSVLRIDRLKRAGSRALGVRDFLNGCPMKPGDRFVDG